MQTNTTTTPHSQYFSQRQILEFWNRITKTDSCWIWNAYSLPSGKPVLNVGGKSTLAARVSFIIHGGIIPEFHYVMPTCKNSLCVNPEHLKAVPRRGFRGTLLERFWKKVNKFGPLPAIDPALGNCWIWTASLDTGGYGAFGNSIDGKCDAHRFSWILHNGPISDGLFVLHKCDVRACLRPDHLFLGTNADNMRDAVRKGKLGVLTDEKVLAIRRTYRRGIRGLGCETLAKNLGVSAGAVRAALNGWTWKHLPLHPE